MVNMKAANILKLSKFYQSANHTSQPWLRLLWQFRNQFFATTTKLLSLFGSYIVRLLRLNIEHLN